MFVSRILQKRGKMLDYKYYTAENAPTKETIILLHGIGGNSKIFYKQIDEFKKDYNLLAIDLPGHGKSPDIDSYHENFSFDLVVNEIKKTMDHLVIKKGHFVGISLGSIIIHNILQKAPERVTSAVLGGAVTGFNLLSNILLVMGKAVKKVAPHMWLYSLFANIMMPKKNHKKSRNIFIKEAKKMKRANFFSWFGIIPKAKSTYKNVQIKSKNIPKLYISGEEDHLFVKRLLIDVKGDNNAEIMLLKQCGHVCNIEKPLEFNEAALDFIKENIVQSNSTLERELKFA